MSQLSPVIDELKRLEKENAHWKTSPDGSSCNHSKLYYQNLVNQSKDFVCYDCGKIITEGNDPERYKTEKELMIKVDENDKSEMADAINRGISIAFLVEFCTAFDLWEVSVHDTHRNYIIPMTSEHRCRFVDLPVFKNKEYPEVVGRADTFVTHTNFCKFGDLVAAISKGADLNRKVYIWGFAARQWPGSKNDWFLEYVIQRCSSLIVFCPDPPELLTCSDISDLPETVKELVPFSRMWCMYEIYFAAMSNGVSIVVKCGHHERRKFIANKEVLETLVKKVDIDKTSVTFAVEREYFSKKFKAMPTGFSDIDKMNSKLRGVLRAAAATTCGDPLLHNAACGDKHARMRVSANQSKYIHQIAIAGYYQLLKAALEGSPTLLDTVEEDTGRSLLSNAAWGGSLKCVHFIAELGARRDVEDKDGKTALSFAKDFGYSDCEEFLSRDVPPTFYIKHVQSQLYLVNDKNNDHKLVLRDFESKPVDSELFCFRFVDNQLQNIKSRKFVCSVNGRKESGLAIGLYDERSFCYPFDYDHKRCLLTGGDNFFVKIDSFNRLVWHKYKGTNDEGTYDENNPFVSGNGFEFEVIFHPPLETYTKNPGGSTQTSSSATHEIADTVHLEYHKEFERIRMSEQIHESMFPRSYLVDYVQERPPYNGKITKIPKGDLGYKTIANDSITQRMFLITANIERLEFSFSKNPWEWETGCNFGDEFTQLISFKLNDMESVSNSSGSNLTSETLSIELDKKYPYFEHIKVQCVLSLQNNPSNVKHICYLEGKARNSTATMGGTLLPC